MAKKKGNGGIVYSTNPDFVMQKEQETETLSSSDQRLSVKKDTKHRKGKVVTLVEGFSGKEGDLASLGKKLKTACGTGGSTKDGLIIIQGDHLEKVRTLLKDWGFGVK